MLNHNLKQPFIRIKSVCTKHWESFVAKWQIRLFHFGLWFRSLLGSLAISLFALACGTIIMFVPHIRHTVDNFEQLGSILSQFAVIYGTVLALVLTLSIIPIQRAAEVWSHSVVRLYRRDPATYITLVALGIFCVFSFMLSVKGLLPVPASMLLAISLTILGGSLDMLRWYQGHVCLLLNPVHAVQQVLNTNKQMIDKTMAQVSRASIRQHRLLDKDQKRELSIEAIEATIYSQMPQYTDSINFWISDLSEIGMKAIARGEKTLARAAILSITELTNDYISSRKTSLILLSSPESLYLTSKSNIDQVTSLSYEALQEMSRMAVTNQDEVSAINVTKAYHTIALHTAYLKTPAFREGTTPLTFSPIYYACECIKYAQSKELHETVFQSSGIISKIAENAPQNIAVTDIHTPVIDRLTEIALYFYGQSKYGLAEEVNGYSFSILSQLLQKKDIHFLEVLREVLEKMELIAPFAIFSESKESPLSTIHPLGKAYGLVSTNSLGSLFEQAALTLPKIDKDREWVNPYNDLVKFTDILWRHLRNIAEKNEFNNSLLLWEINQTIKHIAKVVYQIVENPLRKSYSDERDLFDKFTWVLSFYWVAFSSKKTLDGNRANECCEVLMFIGLLFLKHEPLGVMQSCISHIRSIIESYCEIVDPLDHYMLGDLFVNLWGIKIVMLKQKKDFLAEEVEKALVKRPRGLTEEQWEAAQDAILLRRMQFEERMEDSQYRFSRNDDGEAIAHKLLYG